jgi:fatty-acyl-CoA synthase
VQDTSGDPADSPGTLAECVRRAARVGPDRAALCWQDRSWTWAHVDARVDRAAAWLASLDLPPGSSPCR